MMPYAWIRGKFYIFDLEADQIIRMAAIVVYLIIETIHEPWKDSGPISA
jgi:hypothetical protein